MNKHMTLCALLALTLTATSQPPAITLPFDGVHSLTYPFGTPGQHPDTTLYRFSTLGALSGARADIGRAMTLDSSQLAGATATLGAESGEPLLYRLEGHSARNREHLTNAVGALRIPYLSTTLGGGMRHDGTFTDRFEDYANAYFTARDQTLPFNDLGARGLAEYRFGALSFVQPNLQANAAGIAYDHWALTPFYASPLFTTGWQGLMQGAVQHPQQGLLTLRLSHDQSQWYSAPDTALEHATTALHLSYQRTLWRGLHGAVAVQHNSFERPGFNASLTLADSTCPGGIAWGLRGGFFAQGKFFGDLSAALPLPLNTLLRVQAASAYQPPQQSWWFSYLDRRVTVAQGNLRTNTLQTTLSAQRTLGLLQLQPSLSAVVAAGVGVDTKDSISTTSIVISQVTRDKPIYKAQSALTTDLAVGWMRWTTQMGAQMRNRGAVEPLWIPWMVHSALSVGAEGDSLPYGKLRAEVNGPVEQVQLQGVHQGPLRTTLPSRAALYFEAALPFWAPLWPEYLKPTIALCAGPFSLDGFSRRVRYHPQGSIRGAMVKVELRGNLKRR